MADLHQLDDFDIIRQTIDDWRFESELKSMWSSDVGGQFDVDWGNGIDDAVALYFGVRLPTLRRGCHVRIEFEHSVPGRDGFARWNVYTPERGAVVALWQNEANIDQCIAQVLLVTF